VFAPGLGVTMRALIVLAVVGVLGVGASTLARRAPATAFFLLAYAAIVVIWPYAPDRFIWGVWPLLVLTLALGAAVGVRGTREWRASGLPLVGNAALVVAAGALAFGLIRYNARGYEQRWWDTAQRALARQLLPLVDWVQQSTQPADIIASDGDPLVHLYTGRYVVPSARWAAEAYPAGVDSATAASDLRELLAAYPVRYLLFGSSRSPTARATALLQQEPKPRLEMLTVLQGGGAVFVVRPGANGK
jgi:hypothetical protein